MQNFQINGTFGEKIIDTEIFLANNSNKILINFHDLYGHKYGSENKFLRLAKNFSEENIANVVLFSSSRKNLAKNPEKSDYENKIANFYGKNFEDEVQDAINVINFILENSEKIFGISKENVEIIINGNSLGGTIAFFVAKNYPQIKVISTVAGALRSEKVTQPILSTYPSVNEIIKNLQKFHGKYIMHEAENDVIFAHENYENFYENITNTMEKQRFLYEKTNHNFTKIDNEKSEIPYKKVMENLTNFLKN